MAVEVTLFLGEEVSGTFIGEISLPLKGIDSESQTYHLLKDMPGSVVKMSIMFAQEFINKDGYGGKLVASNRLMFLADALDDDFEDEMFLVHAKIAASTLRQVAVELPHFRVVAFWH